jgi:hypothetical protein
VRAFKRQKGKKALREISFSIWYLVKSGTRDCSIPNGPKEEKKEEEKVVENLGAVFFNTVMLVDSRQLPLPDSDVSPDPLRMGERSRERKKLTAAASHENFSRTLNGYVFCTNQLIMYDLLAILPC